MYNNPGPINMHSCGQFLICFLKVDFIVLWAQYYFSQHYVHERLLHIKLQHSHAFRLFVTVGEMVGWRRQLGLHAVYVSLLKQNHFTAAGGMQQKVSVETPLK